ncbi:hypothetical protein C8J56DRAFT_1083145 [Mycena floridula]|nr:hypothetical protein C8J56DRAFT_1083145 [Mycena floridula]
MDMNSFVNAIQAFNSMGPTAQTAFLGAFNQSQPTASIPSTTPASAQTQHISFTPSSQTVVQGQPRSVWPIPRPLPDSDQNPSQNQIQQPSQTYQQPPAVAPYQSSRLQGLPAPNSGNAGASLGAMASRAPDFMGMNSVGVSLAQQETPTNNAPVNVNEARLRSALNSLPQHNPPPIPGQSQQRGQAPNRRSGNSTRPRTNAVRPPRPPPERPVQAPGISDCFFTDLSNQRKIRIAVHVHPEAAKRPKSDMEPWEKTDQIVYHRNLAYEEQAFAEYMGLHHEYDVLPETDVKTILLMVKRDMEQHSHKFVFQARDPQSCISANRWTRESEVPFMCMEFCNGGRITPTMPVRMRAAALSNLISIEQVTQISNIAVKPFCISKRNQFIFHIRLKRAVKATFSLADVGLGQDRRVREHTCMSIRYNNDNRFRYDSSDVSDRVDDEDSDCGDEDDEAEVEDVIMEEYLPALRTSNLPIIPITGLWSAAYTPPIPDIHVSVRNFTEDIFRAANRHNDAVQELNLSASSSEGLAEKLLDVIIEAIQKKDFSLVLSPRRFLRVIHEPVTVPASSGFGVEMEALTFLLGKYRQGSRRNAFFKTLHEDRASICFSTSMRTAGSVSSQRLLHLEVLGAIIGLMLAHCRYPEPLGPFLLKPDRSYDDRVGTSLSDRYFFLLSFVHMFPCGGFLVYR